MINELVFDLWYIMLFGCAVFLFEGRYDICVNFLLPEENWGGPPK